MVVHEILCKWPQYCISTAYELDGSQSRQSCWSEAKNSSNQLFVVGALSKEGMKLYFLLFRTSQSSRMCSYVCGWALVELELTVGAYRIFL